MPTRNGRNALAFTDQGVLRLRNLCHQADERPLEEDCPCAACRRSRAYLRHLFVAREMLGPILLSLHNLTYYQRLLQRARQAIEQRSVRRVLPAADGRLGPVAVDKPSFRDPQLSLARCYVRV